MLGRALARALVVAAGTVTGLRLAPRTTRPIGPIDASARVTLGWTGGLDVDVPPLGAAHLRTHRGPLTLRARAERIDLDRARALLGSGPAAGAAPTGSGSTPGGIGIDAGAAVDELRRQATDDARRLAATTAGTSVLAALVATSTLAALVFRRPRDVAVSSVGAATLLAAVGAVAALTRDPSAVRDPKLTGLLDRAPLILGDVRAIPDNLARYRDQLAELLTTATTVFDRVADLPVSPPDDAIRLVHVSDVHLSPLALPLARVLVERYRAAAVIDTGDLVDWGTPAEQAFAGQIAELGVPYVYVEGNHDSAGIAAAVARQPNGVVLTADTPPQTVAGLRMVGFGDPRFTPDKTTGDDHAHHRVGEAAREFAATLRAQAPDDGTDGTDGTQPLADLALVHAPAAARALDGLVPLVLAGDIHRREARTLPGGTTVLVQGTSGGAGLRGVQQSPPVPLTLSVVYLDRVTRRLWGADDIVLDGIGGTGVRVERHTAAELTGAAT